MQISANNLLQAAQQAFSAKPAASPRQPAAQSFEPMNFAPETSEPSTAASATQGVYQRPGSQVDIRI
jgi:hypothetical protein